MTQTLVDVFLFGRGGWVMITQERKKIFMADPMIVLGDPEVTANLYCQSRNLPNTDTQNYSTDLR